MTTPEKTRHRLVLKALQEFSLVDIPAQTDALIHVTKRKTETADGGTGMSDEALSKMMEMMGGVASSVDAIRKGQDALTKRVDDIEKAKGKGKMPAFMSDDEDEGEEDTAKRGDRILKGATPELVEEIMKLRRENQRASTELNKMADEREIKKAADTIEADFPALPVKPSEFAPIYKRAMGALEEGDAEVLNQVLKAASNAIAKMTERVGSDFGTPVSTSVEAEIEKKAKERQAADNISFAKAYDKVIRENPDMYRKFLAERGEAH